jgi:hypothetical protein
MTNEFPNVSARRVSEVPSRKPPRVRLHHARSKRTRLVRYLLAKAGNHVIYLNLLARCNKGLL